MSRLSCIALLLLCGCGQFKRNDPPEPKPDIIVAPIEADTATGFGNAVAAATRETYRETARKLEAKLLTTPEAMIADESKRFDDAFDKAAQGLANREQRETQPGWTPEKAAAYRRKLAGEP
jgi:apolipoprotein N-acyltransferase